MTTTNFSKGQAVTLRPVRERQRISTNGDVLRFELSNGDILLHRVRMPKKSLAWHMRRLQGVEIEHNRETAREIQL